MKCILNFHENSDAYLPLDEFMFKKGFFQNTFRKILFFYLVDPTPFHFTKSEQNILYTYYFKSFL